MPYKRRQYLVDRDYQLRFVTRIFMAVLAIAVLSSLIASAVVWTNVHRPELEPNALLNACLLTVAIILLIELILSIPIIAVLSIRQSHRIVGPINRIKTTLEAIGRGDFTQRIAVRHGDALEDLAASINQMAQRLQQQFPRSPGS